MSNIGIYKITSPTNKVYIGQSWGLRKREGEYRNLSDSIKKQRKIYNSLKKYGWGSHKFEIVMYVSENVTQQMFDQIEQAYMDYYRDNGYELMNIREAGSAGKLSEETKKRISEAKKNPSEETRKKMSIAGKNKVWADGHMERMIANQIHLSGPANPCYGRPAHNRGKHLSNETKAKLRDSTLKFFEEKGHPRLGLTHSPESLKRISDSKKGQGVVPILQYSKTGEFIKEWPSIKSACDALGIFSSNICACLNPKCPNKTAGGYVWKYKNENN